MDPRVHGSSCRLGPRDPRLPNCILPPWPVLVEASSEPGFVQCGSDGERVTRCGETGDFQGILWLSLAFPPHTHFCHASPKVMFCWRTGVGAEVPGHPTSIQKELPCPSPGPFLIPSVPITPRRVTSCLRWSRRGCGVGGLDDGPHLLLQQGLTDISVPVMHK